MAFSKRDGIIWGGILVVGLGVTWLMNKGPSNTELYQQTVKNLSQLPQELCANRDHFSLKYFAKDDFVDFSLKGVKGVLRAYGNRGEPVVSQVQIQRGQVSGVPLILSLPLADKEQNLVLDKIETASQVCLEGYRKKQKEQNQQTVDPGATGSVNNSSEFYAYVELGSKQNG
jgi:hypothetical protein